jgi:hypothetical protein
MRNLQEVIFITHSQAQDLVERIATRASEFNHTMSAPEKEGMADLLSDIGVKTDDLIDVSHLADNYAINAEIVTPNDYHNNDMERIKEDHLFSWEENGETHYCLTW